MSYACEAAALWIIVGAGAMLMGIALGMLLSNAIGRAIEGHK